MIRRILLYLFVIANLVVSIICLFLITVAWRVRFEWSILLAMALILLWLSLLGIWLGARAMKFARRSPESRDDAPI